MFSKLLLPHDLINDNLCFVLIHSHLLFNTALVLILYNYIYEPKLLKFWKWFETRMSPRQPADLHNILSPFNYTIAVKIFMLFGQYVSITIP